MLFLISLLKTAEMGYRWEPYYQSGFIIVFFQWKISIFVLHRPSCWWPKHCNCNFLPLSHPPRMAWWWKSQKGVQRLTVASANRSYRRADAATSAEVCLPLCFNPFTIKSSFLSVCTCYPSNFSTLYSSHCWLGQTSAIILFFFTSNDFFLAEIPIRGDWFVFHRAPAMPICLNPAALARKCYRVNSHQSFSKYIE